MEGAAGAADAEMEIVRESTTYKLNALKETWVGVAQSITSREGIGAVIDGFTALSDVLGNVVKFLGPGGSILTGIMGFAGFKSGGLGILGNIIDSVKNRQAYANDQSFISLMKNGGMGLSPDVIDKITPKIGKYTDQLNALKSSYAQGKITQQEFESGLEEIGKTSQTVGAKFTGLLKNIGGALVNAGISFLISKAIEVIYTAIDKVVNRAQYAREAMNAAFDTYKEDKDSLESINTELDAQNEEMDKLIAKGSDMTGAEAARLAELKKSTAELERQAYYAEQTANASAMAAVNAAIDSFNEDYHPLDGILGFAKDVADFYNGLPLPDIDYFDKFVEQLREDDADAFRNVVQEQIDAYDEAINRLDSTNENSNGLKNWEADIDAAKTTLSKAAIEIREKLDLIELLPKDQWTTEIQDYYNEFTEYYDKIQSRLDPVGWAKIKFTNLISDSSLKVVAETLKAEERTISDLKKEFLSTGKIGSLSFQQIGAVAKDCGFQLDNTKDTVFQLIEYLADLGYVITDIDNKDVNTAKKSFEEFTESLETATNRAETLDKILAESMSGTGISFENIESFREIFGADAEDALERTASGFHLNAQGLETLTKKQQALQKINFASSLKEQYDALRNIDREIAASLLAGNDTTQLQADRDLVLKQIQDIRDQQLAYEGLTSAYAKWQQAKSSANEHDTYDSVISELSNVDDLIARGWYNQDDVTAYLGYLTGEDLANAGYEAVTAARAQLDQKLEGTEYSLMDFFTVDENGKSTNTGVWNFLDAVEQRFGETYAHIDETGKGVFDFTDGKEAEIIEWAHTSGVALQDLLKAAIDAGFEVHLDQPISELEELRQSAEEAKKSLDEFDTIEPPEINLDSTSYAETSEDIEELQKYIEELESEDIDIDPSVKSEKIEQAKDLITFLELKLEDLYKTSEFDIAENWSTQRIESTLETLNEQLAEFRDPSTGEVDIHAEGAEDVINQLHTVLLAKQMIDNDAAVLHINTSDADQGVADFIDKLAEYHNAMQELEAQRQLQETYNVPVDTTEAEEKVATLKEEIATIVEGGIGATLNLDLSGTPEELDAQIKALTPDVVLGLDPKLVKEYVPEDKEAKVHYKVDRTVVDNFIKENHDTTAKIQYTAEIEPESLELVKNTIQATASVAAIVGGSKVTGTAHAGGNWGTKKTENALVGEMAPEILVNPDTGRWELIGEHGAEIRRIPKGSIIFNGKQTEEILKNGYTTSRGKQVGGASWVGGTAYATFTIGGSRGTGAGGRVSGTGISSYNTSKNAKDTATAADSAAQSYNNVASAASNAATSTESAAEAASDFEETIDWIETKISRLERTIDKLSRTADSSFEKYEKRNTAIGDEIGKVTEQIGVEQQAYNRYLQEANSVGLAETWAKKVRDGVIDIEKITDENLKKQIDEYRDWYEKAIETSDAVDELKENLKGLYQTKFENVQEQFDNITGEIESQNDLLQSQIDLIETEGYTIGAEMYEALAKNQADIMAQQQAELSALEKALGDAVNNGKIKEGSAAWYDMKTEINNVTKAILESQKAIADYGKEIRQLKWDAFDKLQDNLLHIIGEAEFMIDLLDAYDLFDEKGYVKDNGKATFGLHAAEYNTYMLQADKYASELLEIQRELAEDPYNNELLEHRQDLLEAQQQAIQNAEKEKDAIKSLVKEGIDKQISSLKDLISTYTDLLDKEKD